MHASGIDGSINDRTNNGLIYEFKTKGMLNDRKRATLAERGNHKTSITKLQIEQLMHNSELTNNS